jgi:hypothetical protein
MANQNLQQPSSSWPTTRSAEGSTSMIERTEKAAEQAAGSAIDKVRSVKTGISEQRNQVAERIRRVGNAMRESGDRVRKEDEMAADYFRMASQGIDRAASYVTSADFATIAGDTQEFIRKRPAVFFGGAFLVGLAAGRFLRASGGAITSSSGTFRPMGAYDSSSRGSKRLPGEEAATPTPSSSASSSPAPSSSATPAANPAPDTGVRWSATAQGSGPAKPPAGPSDTGDNPHAGSRSRLP